MKARRLAALLIVACASGARAATFIVPDDAELVRASKAVVIATAGASQSRIGAAVETVTTLTVERSIKGALTAGATVEVVTPGGSDGARTLIVAGAPRFRDGERVLLFLDTNRRGEWTTRLLTLGKFNVDETLAVRQNVCGFTPAGEPHREPLRLAREFIRFAERTAAGDADAPRDYITVRAPRLIAAPDATPPASSYLMRPSSGGPAMRWSSFPSAAVFRSVGSQPGAAGGGLTAAQRGLSVWTSDAGSNILYVYGGTGPTTGGLQRSDEVNSIAFNDPNREIDGAFNPVSGATLAIGGVWAATRTHAYAGESFYTIVEADLVVQDGLAGAGLTGNGFDHVIAHELGHTLGLRHSDQPPAGGTSTSNALMNSSVNFNADPTGAALLAWDVEAIAAVYGAGGGGGGGGIPSQPEPCMAPSISQQPRSFDTRGEAVVLSTEAGGSPPLRYQWYSGTKGQTGSPIAGANGSTLSIQPSTTRSYWVRVSSDCPPAADSETATITVNGCPAVVVTSQPAGAAILQGNSVALSVQAAGGNALRYQWYTGAAGDTSRPVGGATSPSISVSPASTMSYWVLVTNDCGATAASSAATIEVEPCSAARILVHPEGGDVAMGESATLYAAIAGSQPMQVAWYEGMPPDTTRRLANAMSAGITTQPLLAPATFWMRVTNPCGSVDSTPAAFGVTSGCRAPAIAADPQHVSVLPGGQATLRVGATGTSLIYRWYQGSRGNRTRPVGGSSPTLITPPVMVPTDFWADIRNSCGMVSSAVAKVTPEVPSRRRSVGR